MIVFLFTLEGPLPSCAQTPPYALLQDATVAGMGNSLVATHLPVVTSRGIVYWNVTVDFDVSTTGALTVAPGYPQIVASTAPSSNGFVQAIYQGPDYKGTELIQVTGPSVGPNGVTVWSIAPATGSSGCLYPSIAGWYDVGSNLKNNPLYAKRLQPAGITSTAMQYGTGNANCGGPYWETNTLIGFSETGGSALVISSFTSNGVDNRTPVDTKTYTLVKKTASSPALSPNAADGSSEASATPKLAAASATPPYVLLEDATLSASGNVLTATRLPVVTAKATVYRNVVLEFSVATNGTLTLASGYPQFVASAAPIVNGFLAGNYRGPDYTTTELLTVSGPGVATGGATVWSIAPATGSSGCLYPFSATWFNVGTNLAQSPLSARLQKAGITSTLLQYGVGSANCGGPYWETDSLPGNVILARDAMSRDCV